MKYFAFVALFMMLAIQAFALPAAPQPASAPKVAENQPTQSPEAQVYEEAHSGAAKDKRAVFVYTSPAVVPYPTLFRYSYVPFYPPVAPTYLF